jgi:hypothetical protein
VVIQPLIILEIHSLTDLSQNSQGLVVFAHAEMLCCRLGTFRLGDLPRRTEGGRMGNQLHKSRHKMNIRPGFSDP